MSGPQFAAGPWVFLPTDEQMHAVVSPQRDTDEQWFTAIVSCTDDAVEDATARLIAAAPELYEALILAGEHINSLRDEYSVRDTVNDPYPEYIRTVLAKARGEQVSA